MEEPEIPIEIPIIEEESTPIEEPIIEEEEKIIEEFKIIENEIIPIFVDTPEIISHEPINFNEHGKLYRCNNELCEDFLRSPENFQIFFNGRLIFDSSTTDRSNLQFFKNYFTLYSKSFPYKGMRIRKKIKS